MPKARLKVLVVEDDVGLGEAIARLLGAAGIEACLYSSAEALLANGAVANADCVISDWRLPALSGLDMLDALHARGWRLPLILITAHEAPGLREEAERRGASRYLVKPFRGTALLEAIAALTHDRPGRPASAREAPP
jgi:two-component system response regulator FixJ